MTTEWQKPKPWKGNDLLGTWKVTLKVDGVQARLTMIDGKKCWMARSTKPLYNLDHLVDTMKMGAIFEVYDGKSWDTTVGLVRRSKNGEPVPAEYLYELWPNVDKRLLLDRSEKASIVGNLSASVVKDLMQLYVDKGYEGLVLLNVETGERLKVKPSETHDVRVAGIQAGTGKHEGRMGALLTTKGKVGTGFSDEDRVKWWARRKKITEVADAKWGYTANPYIIEVECMGLTKAGKFRHPRYLRDRFDKNEES